MTLDQTGAIPGPPPTPAEAATVPALEVTGLVYAYKENRAVDGIDLSVAAGSVYGLRSLLIGSATDLPLDLGVLLGSAVLAVAVASSLLPRLSRG